MARLEYKQRAEYKQIWPIHIGILTETSQNPRKQALKICLESACIPSFSLCLRDQGYPGLPGGPLAFPWVPLALPGCPWPPWSSMKLP